jgi:hypothetical protein
MNNERSTVMYATQLPRHNGGTYLSGFAHSEPLAKLFFGKPVEQVVVRDLHEGEASEYWAWWDARNGRFDYVFLSRWGVEMCFPYGTRIESEKGNGEVVNVTIDESES